MSATAVTTFILFTLVLSLILAAVVDILFTFFDNYQQKGLHHQRIKGL